MPRIRELLKDLQTEIQKERKEQNLPDGDLRDIILAIGLMQADIGQILLTQYSDLYNCSFVMNHIESLRKETAIQIFNKIGTHLSEISVLVPSLENQTERMLEILKEGKA